MNAELASFHALVYGRVQGVFYRSYVAGHAREMEITGYARNLADGSVEVRAEGKRQSLEALAGFLKKGPPHAGVVKVDITWADYTGKYPGFDTA